MAKTLYVNVKNSNQPLRRKYNNIPTGNNTRRIGDELRRIGVQMSELTNRVVEDDKNRSQNLTTSTNHSAISSVLIP